MKKIFLMCLLGFSLSWGMEGDRLLQGRTVPVVHELVINQELLSRDASSILQVLNNRRVSCEPQMLQVAIQQCTPNVIEALLRAGADVRNEAPRRTFLSIALHEGNPEKVRLLLAAGANAYAARHYYITPILEALMITNRQQCAAEIVNFRKHQLQCDKLLFEIPWSEEFKARLALLDANPSIESEVELRETFVMCVTGRNLINEATALYQVIRKHAGLRNAFFATLIHALKVSHSETDFAQIYDRLRHMSESTLMGVDLEEVMLMAVNLQKWSIIYYTLMKDASPRKAKMFAQSKLETVTPEQAPPYHQFLQKCGALDAQRSLFLRSN